jgi:hypothetical protein
MYTLCLGSNLTLSSKEKVNVSFDVPDPYASLSLAHDMMELQQQQKDFPDTMYVSIIRIFEYIIHILKHIYICIYIYMYVYIYIYTYIYIYLYVYIYTYTYIYI